MPVFKVLYIKEFYSNATPETHNESDHNIIILYDDLDATFYYYGTRARESDSKKKYIDYSGSYSYDAFQNFHDFLKYLLDGNRALITNELYEIHISENEYTHLSFSKLKAKFFKGALLSAYDLQPNNGTYLEGLLSMLINY